ncbi:MAG: sigma 54-interacting transcriptional regulator [Synergistaceae bacterium]|jgi:transcriptional regulator with PAS, ATPase and Fis domain|nr:sigma 54-interacting transcriptional regulator [Synergistaceae bacterium]
MYTERGNGSVANKKRDTPAEEADVSSKSNIDRDLLIKYLLGMTNEMIAIVSHEGLVVELSQAYAEFLGITRKAAIGRHVTDVIDNTRLHIVAVTGVPEVEKIQKIKGHDAVVTRLPIIEDGKVIGSFARVLFKDLNDLDILYGKLNRAENELRQYKKKFGMINAARYGINDIIGKSQLMLDLKNSIRRIAKTSSNVIILGESGTGKELFAHAIHNESSRAANPFVSVNCGSIPSELVESELFGYEEGSFTGARKGGMTGLFQAADKGAIFLDEISELPMSMQVKLLRVLQEREIKKIGASQTIPIDVRVIAASNKDLYQLISEGKFRADLYYRLNVIGLHIPPLRVRKEDIPLLVDSIIKKLSAKENIRVERISPGAMAFLKSYDWPGNIRELENILERALNFIENDKMIHMSHLPGYLRKSFADVECKPLHEIIKDSERRAIANALSKYNGNKSKASKALGISRTSLYEKMQKHQIDLSL